MSVATPATCADGSGSPTVVYLHGYIHSSFEGGGSNSGTIPGFLRDDYGVCVYDRANVDRSDPVEGRQTGADSVRTSTPCFEPPTCPGPISCSPHPSVV